MISSWAYILIGDNNTGKTSFQRNIVNILGKKSLTSRLNRNLITDIVNDRAPRQLQKLFTCNRSIQELPKIYTSVEVYFRNHFDPKMPADVCFLSSHSHGNAINYIREMKHELARRCYNVGGVFFKNDFGSAVKDICELDWDERFWIENPATTVDGKWERQIAEQAEAFAAMIMRRAWLQ